MQKKVHYLAGIYSKMHRNIVPHPVALDRGNLHLLDGATFAFICMDAGEPKKLAVRKCEEMGIPFIDVGMGLELDDGSLGGILRVTASTPDMRTTSTAAASRSAAPATRTTSTPPTSRWRT